MANKTLIVQIDPKNVRDIQATIDRFQQEMKSMDGFFDAVEMHMIDSLTRNFEQEGRPLPWKELSPITIELKGSEAILQDTGALKDSINSANTSRSGLSLMIWSGEKHGLFHQYVDIDPTEQFSMVNEKGMPMRPFMLFQKEDYQEIDQILARYIDDVLKG